MQVKNKHKKAPQKIKGLKSKNQKIKNLIKELLQFLIRIYLLSSNHLD